MEVKDLLKSIEEIKTNAAARIDELSLLTREQAERIQKLEQSGFASPPIDGGRSVRSAGAIVTNSPELARMRENRSKQRVSIALKSFASAFEMKATTLLSPAAGNPTMRSDEIFSVVNDPNRVAVRSLIPSRATSAGSVDYVQVTVAGVAGAQVTEGSVKPQIDINPVVVNAKVVTIAGWTSASRQVVDDNLLLDDFVNSMLMDALRVAEDFEILKGDGSPGHMNGIWTQAQDYSRHVSSDKPVDDLRRACTQVQLMRGLPTGIVISPEGLERLELTHDSTGAYMLELEVDGFNRTIAWRTPVIVSAALGSSEFLVGDFSRGARLYDRQAATIEMSNEHADWFTRNLVAVLAEERLALAVQSPRLFVRGTFTPG